MPVFAKSQKQQESFVSFWNMSLHQSGEPAPDLNSMPFELDVLAQFVTVIC